MHVGLGAFFQNPGRARSDAEVWRQGLDIAGRAELMGFDSVWFRDHVVYRLPYEPIARVLAPVTVRPWLTAILSLWVASA